MVDAVVSFVVERLGDYIINEAAFLRGVKDDLAWLKKEFEWMQCFTKDAEQKQVDDPIILKWLSDIRDIAYDTEDVLDGFRLQVDDGSTSNMLEEDQGETSNKSTGFFASIKKCSCLSVEKGSSLYSKGKKTVNLYSLGKEIQAIKTRINDLSRKRELYSLEDIGQRREGKSSRLKQLRRATSFAVEENVVGFEDDADKLLNELLSKEPHRSVISIFGMGGLGKTTLARKLYNNNFVKKKFNCCAWVSVSQDYNTQDLLLRVIKSFRIGTRETKELEMMSEDDLERYLYASLQGQPYLVVIDDVWEKEAWQSLKRAFPDNHNGSRVIITTRSKDVAERSDERTHVHQLRFLTSNESWQLFCQKAFKNSNADAGLENLGKDMVEKCGGLPLAIVVLGGLLSAKPTQGWHMVRDHLWQFLRNDSIEISYLLALSFNDLPYQLKMCFLYLGLFPEDFEINVDELIRLFVAEGFISLEDETQILEDVARDNVQELINRSLIQIEKRYWGKIETCRVHDLLRDLAIQKAKEVNIFHVYDEIKPPTSSSSVASCRRQAIYSFSERCPLLQHTNPLSRSFFFFNNERSSSLKNDNFLTPLCTKLKLLRVLNIKCATGFNLPEEIGELIHLKYLGLKVLFVRELPRSVLNLRSLQTLEVFGVDWSLQLPTHIFKLQELRHLIGSFEGDFLIDNMMKLQTLKWIDGGIWTKANTEKLVNLRELHIQWSHRSAGMKFTFDSIAKLKSLQILSVSVSMFDSHPFASVEPLSHCQNLFDLRLYGNIEKLHGNMHAILPNLQFLSLGNSNFKEDPMLVLEKLPVLLMLELDLRYYSGKNLICTASGFPRLEILKISINDDIEWQVKEGALPKLRGLRFPRNSNFKIPEKLRSVPLPGILDYREEEPFWLS